MMISMRALKLSVALAFFGLSCPVYSGELSAHSSDVQTEILMNIYSSGKARHHYRVKISDDPVRNIEKLQFEDRPAADFVYSAPDSFWNEWNDVNKFPANQLNSFLLNGESYRLRAFSPNRKFVALSVLKNGEGYSGKILIIDIASMAVVDMKMLTEGRFAAALSWSPDSLSLAILEQSKRTGVSPFNLLMAFSGHPVPYNDFFLAAISLPSKKMEEASSPFVSNVPYGDGAMLWRNMNTMP